MDWTLSLTLWLLQQGVKNTDSGSWQAFVIANMALIVAVAFWCGIQANKISDMVKRRKEDREWTEREFNLLRSTSQEVNVAKLEEKLDHVMDRIDMLQEDFDEFRKSILLEALRISHQETKGGSKLHDGKS